MPATDVNRVKDWQERMSRANAEYRQIQGQLGTLAVKAKTGEIDGNSHAARREKLDLEEALRAAEQELQAAMKSNPNLPPA